nr:unnamed protein product [Digitaria exilis]
MASMKLGSKPDAFKRQGQAWFCTTGLPSDVTVEVGDMSFHLHKFPLLSKSAFLARSIEKNSDQEECVIKLNDIPGGAKSFELVARFCYGVKIELSPANVVYLRCASEHLEMTEEVAEDNLIAQSEIFLNQVVLRNWKDSLIALETCDELLPRAEDLQIVKRCIESLASKATTDPNLFGWPIREQGIMQSPGGSVLWNGISTGARPRNFNADWWYDDASSLSFPMYKRLISTMESRGIRPEIIAGSLMYYAKKYLPGLNRRHSMGTVPLTATLSEAHSWLSEAEREQLCRLLDCQKLSLEACTHAAQNERLPLRVVVQVLFFEQLQLRTSIAGCLLVSDNLEGSRPLRSGIATSGEAGGWSTTVRENQVLKVGMDNMRMRLAELEKECSNMRQEIEKLGGRSSKGGGGGWASRVVPRRIGLKVRSQMCSAQEGSVSEQQKSMSAKLEKLQAKVTKQKKQLAADA